MSTITATNAIEPIVSIPTSKKTRKILHLINGEYYSGAERVQDLLATSLPQFGYEVGFACVKPDRFPEQRASQQCAIYATTMNSKFDLSVGKRIAEIYCEGKYEAIHAHTPRSVFAGRLAWRYLKCPFFYHVHSPAGNDSTRKFSNWFNQRIENWCLRPTNALICVSESLARYMQSIGHSEKKVHVVQNGVPTVKPLAQRSTPEGCWTIGAVALFRPRKGTEVLLQSIADLVNDGVDVRLNAVGPFVSKEYENELKAMSWKLGIQKHVSWLGFQDNVVEQFKKMDLFVLPSLFGEGLPMVVLEAMACGVPVIAAKVEGIPEAIRHERDGLIFEPGNSDELTKQISGLVKGKYDWQEFRKSAYQRQSGQFSEFSMAEGTARIYDQFLA